MFRIALYYPHTHELLPAPTWNTLWQWDYILNLQDLQNNQGEPWDALLSFSNEEALTWINTSAYAKTYLLIGLIGLKDPKILSQLEQEKTLPHTLLTVFPEITPLTQQQAETWLTTTLEQTYTLLDTLHLASIPATHATIDLSYEDHIQQLKLREQKILDLKREVSTLRHSLTAIQKNLHEEQSKNLKMQQQLHRVEQALKVALEVTLQHS